MFPIYIYIFIYIYIYIYIYSESFIVPRLYCVGVLAYDFCDVIVAYYSVGVDGWCDILDIFQSNLAELLKGNNVHDIVLEI